MKPEIPKTKVFVELLNEGTQVWRPRDAIELRPNVFVILSANTDAQQEEWRFKPGEIVSCQNYTFADGSSGLIVVSRIES